MLIEQLNIFAFVMTTYLLFEEEVVYTLYVQGSGGGLSEKFSNGNYALWGRELTPDEKFV